MSEPTILLPLLNELSFDWQPVDAVLDRVILRIPAGKALRRYEKTRTHEVQRRSLKEKDVLGRPIRPRPEPSERQKIRMGAHILIKAAATGGIKRGLIEEAPIDGVRMWRRVERRQTIICCEHGKGCSLK